MKKDLDLVKEAKTGNEKAFTSLVNKYHDLIYYMLLKMVSDPLDAEDLTVEAFEKAFKSIETYTPEYAFSTWLFKIATNNCIDFIRKKQKLVIQQTYSQEDLMDTTKNIPSELPNPEEEFITNQKARDIRDTVNKLDSKYRNLIYLRYYKAYSYEEIASELSLPIGTVKAQLHRAKALLYNIMTKQDVK